MKKTAFFGAILLVLTIFGCQKEEIALEEVQETATTARAGLTDTSNELIILYPDGTTETEKQNLRSQHGVIEYKNCKCADENLELWIFGSSGKGGGEGVDIEDKRAGAKADEEIEGVDFNPTIKISELEFIETGRVGDINDALQKRVSQNLGVTVAVLDTGIEYDYQGFTSPFLFNSEPNNCTDNGYEELFGWNFVAGNNNPYDDHSGRHGTIVSYLIASQLEANNTPYQILPVKVANANGRISYFDALCGFQYAANKSEVDIINMSFGWYAQEHELMAKFIEAAAYDKLIVTSAGNRGTNNDTNPHYPSSYAFDNVFSIAGLRDYTSTGHGAVFDELVSVNNNSNTALSYFSNHGVNSVDIAARSENIPFDYEGETFLVSGTSYSSALISGYSGILHQEGVSPVTLKGQVIANAIYNSGLFQIKYSSGITN